jgi:biotin-(acetyl-CoA carboxylase) ligase
MTVIHLPEVDSTNAEAMRRALAGSPTPLWIVAARQTRGRSGRRWQSQFDGNLYASLKSDMKITRADVADIKGRLLMLHWMAGFTLAAMMALWKLMK